ncbi:hypothetical protein C4J83_1217 [Pseudomonas sp. LBUM920]|nr:hypothetical protein C4J83_1217 [Pseudomonas sp. LBUM920]
MVLAMAGAAAIAWQLQAWRYGLRLERQSASQADALSQQLQKRRCTNIDSNKPNA